VYLLKAYIFIKDLLWYIVVFYKTYFIESNFLKYYCADDSFISIEFYHTLSPKFILFSNGFYKSLLFLFSPCILSFLHLLICVYIVCATSPLIFPTPASRQNLFCPLLWFYWRESIRDNRKDIAFLLVWDKETAIHRDS
jgi:hypothetical protein